jgi:acyl phosphate:glycerol-3-phosphate acyltransferase
MIYLQYLLLLCVSYLFGSFPSAYILMKISEKKDIRSQGSGNVGAMNVLRSSKKKWVALLVLALDLIKGAVPAYYFTRIEPAGDIFILILVSGVLLGHVFPIWLKFKGGRGLAVVAGALLVIKPLLVLIWLVVWAVFYLIIRKHIIASMIATVVLPLVVYFTLGIFFSKGILLMILPVCLIIFQRHLERIPDLISETKKIIENGAKS